MCLEKRHGLASLLTDLSPCCSGLILWFNDIENLGKIMLWVFLAFHIHLGMLPLSLTAISDMSRQVSALCYSVTELSANTGSATQLQNCLLTLSVLLGYRAVCYHWQTSGPPDLHLSHNYVLSVPHHLEVQLGLSFHQECLHIVCLLLSSTFRGC